MFGQLALEIGNSNFDTIDDLIDILLRRLESIGMEEGATQKSLAYKLDEVADWEALCDPVGTTFEQHGGPNAPHVFKFFRRSDLNLEMSNLTSAGGATPLVDDFEPRIERHGNDVFMLTRHFMCSRRHLQVTAVCAFNQRGHRIGSQPTRTRARKLISADLVRLLKSQCRMARDQNLISATASNWLLV